MALTYEEAVTQVTGPGQIFELVEGEGVQALCRYSFTEREQTTTRAGSYTVSGPNTAPEPKSSYSIKYEQRLRTCPRPPIIRQANGVTMRSIRFEAAGPFCRSFLPGDTAYSATGVYPRVRKRFAYYEHGTNTAGFADFAGYPCTSRARRRDGGLRYDLSLNPPFCRDGLSGTGSEMTPCAGKTGRASGCASASGGHPHGAWSAGPIECRV